MHENIEFYNQAAAVNGVQQTGVGVGTLAQRPASGVGGVDIAHVTTNPPGTAYWATDVPSINGSTDKGALYVWRGGAWVLIISLTPTHTHSQVIWSLPATFKSFLKVNLFVAPVSHRLGVGRFCA